MDTDEKSVRFVDGRSEVVNFESVVGSYSGPKVALIGVGDMVETALCVRDRIRDDVGMTPEVINLRFIKPLDVERIRETVEKFDIVAVLEDTVKQGSVGEAVAYEIAETGASCRLLHFCIKDEKLTQGSVTKLREVEGIDVDTVYKTISDLIRVK